MKHWIKKLVKSQLIAFVDAGNQYSMSKKWYINSFLNHLIFLAFKNKAHSLNFPITF